MMLGDRDEIAKGRCMEDYKKENLKVNKLIDQSKKEVNKFFQRGMSQDVNENKKWFWMGVCEVNGGRPESCSRIKDANMRLAL